jgi:hypothetical protein
VVHSLIQLIAARLGSLSGRIVTVT